MEDTEPKTYTQEELDAYLESKVDYIRETVGKESKQEISSLEEKYNDLNRQLEEKNDEIDGLRSKELSFNIVREKAKVADTLKEEIGGLKEQISSVANASKQDIIDDFISEKIGSNQEDIKMFNHYYKMLSQSAASKVEIKKALDDSMVLYAKDKNIPIDTVRNVIPTHGNPNLQEEPDKYTNVLKSDMSRMLGVNKEMVEKHKEAALEQEKMAKEMGGKF